MMNDKRFLAAAALAAAPVGPAMQTQAAAPAFFGQLGSGMWARWPLKAARSRTARRSRLQTDRG